jgi:hypothetical protein
MVDCDYLGKNTLVDDGGCGSWLDILFWHGVHVVCIGKWHYRVIKQGFIV